MANVTDAQADEVRRLIDELAARPPYCEKGGATKLHSDIGITQPGLRKIRKGGGVSQDTARRVAVLSGLDPEHFSEDMPASRYRYLEALLLVHPGRWSVPTIAAARAGVWDSDATAKEWEARLDALSKALKSLSKQH